MVDLLQLTNEIERWLAASDRKSKTYWYPLSMASYGAKEVMEALDSMCSFRTTMWEKTKRFEHDFVDYQDGGEAVMVNSGSSADLLLCFALMGRELQRGDEVLVPIVTWPTQIWSAMMAGLKVRPVDIDSNTLNVDLADLEAKITPDTKAIFLVHLLGNPCDMKSILDLAQQHGLLILEDCCEAMGAKWGGIRVGNFGVGATFSFFFSHHITTMEGGMIVCSDSNFADRLRILRAHGWLRNVSNPPDLEGYDVDPRYAFVNWGFNVRPTELQASFGLHQLQRLSAFNAQRATLAARFFDFVDESPALMRPRVSVEAQPAWFALPILVSSDAPFSRQEIVDYLETSGVETRPIVAGNLARQPVSVVFEELQGSYPGADILHDYGFYVGLLPLLGERGMDRVIETIDEFLRSR